METQNLPQAQQEQDISDHIFISPLDIFEYFGDSRRPIREGTELLEAGWVHAIGIVPPLSRDRILGLVVQTSSVSSCPHEVKLENLRKTFNLWKCICSCKAGLGEKCKHNAACLLHINRYPTLYGISSTEVRQKWGKTGRAIAKKFNSVSTTEMCHVRKKICMRDDKITEDYQETAAMRFLGGKTFGETHSLILSRKW